MKNNEIAKFEVKNGIEIITTKKKLTKSFVNQMQIINDDPCALVNSVVLGFVHRVYKHAVNCAIIKTYPETGKPSQYLIVPFGFMELCPHISKNHRVRYQKGKYRLTFDFVTEGRFNLWWKEYKRIKRQCRERQIYI